MSDPTAPARLDVDRLTQLRRVNALAASPCGTWAALAVARVDADDAKYVHDLWRVDLVDRAAAPRPLTRGASDDRAPHFRRDGALGFLSNRNPRDGKPEEGDEERAQVWILPPGGGEPHPLTDEPLGVQAFRFAPAGDLLVVVAGVLPDAEHEAQRETAHTRKKHGPSARHYDRMPVRHWDHWIPEAAPHLIAYTQEGHERRDLTPTAVRELLESDFDVAPDGSAVAFTSQRPGPDRVNERTLVLIDVATGETHTLAAEHSIDYVLPRFAPDGERIACLRQRRSREGLGPMELWLLDRTSSPDRPGRAITAGWERNPFIWTWDRSGESLIVTADDRGHVPAFRVAVANGQIERLIDPEAGGTHADLDVAGDGSALVGLRHRFIHPPEPFSAPLAPNAKPELVAQLSGFSADEGARVARVESFRVAGAGGTPVQSFLLLPEREDEAAPVPGILWIHGGPWGQWADGWHWRWNPLVPVSAGYALALPNPRGSTGVDHEFFHGIWGRWGAECYEDLMAVTDALEARPELDEDRLAAMGGSFGGYMTNWIGANTDRFRALVTHASLFALSGFHGGTDTPAFWELQMGTPWDDPEGYDEFSPHRRVAGWKTPTLVIHGERDYRVPIHEALGLFEALQRHGVPSELLVFPDENHWILKPRNIRVWYRTFLDFIDRHLR